MSAALDPIMLEAMWEVDAMTPHAPAIAPIPRPPVQLPQEAPSQVIHDLRAVFPRMSILPDELTREWVIRKDPYQCVRIAFEVIRSIDMSSGTGVTLFRGIVDHVIYKLGDARR